MFVSAMDDAITANVSVQYVAEGWWMNPMACVTVALKYASAADIESAVN